MLLVRKEQIQRRSLATDQSGLFRSEDRKAHVGCLALGARLDHRASTRKQNVAGADGWHQFDETWTCTDQKDWLGRTGPFTCLNSMMSSSSCTGPLKNKVEYCGTNLDSSFREEKRGPKSRSGGKGRV